jgi:hypothetical protein
MTKMWLVLTLLSGDPFAALVDAKVCLAAAESFRAGHAIEILGLDGDKDEITNISCQEPCTDGACS